MNKPSLIARELKRAALIKTATKLRRLAAARYNWSSVRDFKNSVSERRNLYAMAEKAEYQAATI